MTIHLRDCILILQIDLIQKDKKYDVVILMTL